MAYYVTALKRRAKDPMMSDEEFVRLLFTPYITAGDIRNRLKAPLDLNKSRISKLIAQKDDIPTAMRRALSVTDIYDNTRPDFIDFVDDYIDGKQLPVLVREISAQINISSSIDTETKSKLTGLETEYYEYLCATFFEALRQNNKQEQVPNANLWCCGLNSICLECGDLFKYGFGNRKKQQNIVVIPVNTSFDTHISWQAEGADNPVVAPTTLHGKWIDRWVKAGNSIEELNAHIDKNLSMQKLTFTVDKAGHKHFDIGTIAVVTDKKAIYYLLAISTFDEYNIAHSTVNEIRTAIKSLMQFYNHYGMEYPMYLPLLGTGLSRAALDYLASFHLIYDELIHNAQFIQGRVTIVASKEAMAFIKAEEK